MTGLLRERVTIMRRTVSGVDSTNDDVAEFAEGETVPASVQPVRVDELVAGRDTAIADVRVYVPAGTTVEAYDRIVHGDRTLEIVGPPEPWHGVGGPDHIRINARWVEG